MIYSHYRRTRSRGVASAPPVFSRPLWFLAGGALFFGSVYAILEASAELCMGVSHTGRYSAFDQLRHRIRSVYHARSSEIP